MAKRVFLIHDWEGYPEEGWRPWLKQKLEERRFKVEVPAMPETIHPKAGAWVSHLAKVVGAPDKDTYFVGHSLGCITILRYLENLKEGEEVGGAILIAAFAQDLVYQEYKGELSSFFQKPVDWQKIKRACQKFVVIHSNDDPWVPVKFGQEVARESSGKFTLLHGMKHFSGDDGITELPIVFQELLSLAE